MYGAAHRPPRCTGDCPYALSVSASTVRLGQDWLGSVRVSVVLLSAIGIDRILPLVSSRRQHFFHAEKIGSGHRL